jgi:hypothetical protein
MQPSMAQRAFFRKRQEPALQPTGSVFLRRIMSCEMRADDAKFMSKIEKFASSFAGGFDSSMMVQCNLAIIRR